MFKKILISSLAVGALAIGAPVAQAAEPTGDCGFNSVQNDTTTGQNYEGVAYGYAVDSDGDSVTLRCYLTVNGSEVASTPAATGTGAVTTQGRVTFAAEDTDDVKLCTEINGVTVSCGDSEHSQIPPQEVIDALDSVFDLLADATAGLDPLICGVLKTAGVPALVNTTTAVTTLSLDTDDCDIYLGGERQIDFVPYED